MGLQRVQLRLGELRRAVKHLAFEVVRPLFVEGVSGDCNEDYLCHCGEPVLRRQLYCSERCYDEHAETMRYADARRAERGQPPALRRWRGECCKAELCGWRRNCVGFRVSDEAWAAVVPPALRDKVVCLECFDEMAEQAAVEYAVLEVFPVTWSTP